MSVVNVLPWYHQEETEREAGTRQAAQLSVMMKQFIEEIKASE